jgi:hypothetical protein
MGARLWSRLGRDAGVLVMTTIRITSADVGVTIAQNGVLSGLRFLVADRGQYAHFTIVDDAPPFDAVPRQIFNSDMLDMPTNKNGALQSPYGACIYNASIAFGNLTVLACQPDAVFEVDTTGALTLAEIEAGRVSPDKGLNRYLAGTVFAQALQAEVQRRRDEAVIAAERVRAWSPPPQVYVVPPPPPPPRPVWMIEADNQAEWLVAKDVAARCAAKGQPTIVGPSLEAIKFELFSAGHRLAVEAEAGAVANEVLQQRVRARAAELAKSQAEATSLLREQGLLGG